MKYSFAVGSGAGEKEAGIYICTLDPEKGEIRALSDISGTAEPTWLEYDADRALVYTGGTREGAGVISVYDLRDRKSPALLKTLSVSGGASCHQALDEKKEFLAVSFYGSGSLSLVRLDEDGLPVCECCHIVHTGSSVHPRRQREAHVHFCGFTGNMLYCCDLGEDRIYEYRLDREKGLLEDTGKMIRTHPGDGPRHFVLSRDASLLYAVTEMGANVSVFSRADGKLLQRIDSIPEEVDRSTLPVIDFDAFGAAIHWLDDRHLLVSNRGDDSISIFAVPEDGLLKRCFTGKTCGRIPRDFGILGRYIVCANQESSDLTVLEVGEDLESFHDTGIRAGIPVPTRILPL